MRRWQTFPYWLFGFLVLFVAVAAWRYDVFACRPYWGAAIGVFAHAQALLDPAFARPVAESSPAPAMYSTSFVPRLVAGLHSILPNASAVVIAVRLLNYACASLALVLAVRLLHRRVGWSGAALAAGAILTTPIFLVQVEQLGLEMFLVAGLVASAALLFEGRGVLAAGAALIAFLAKWTAIAWIAAAFVYLVIETFRPNAARSKSAATIPALAAHSLALAVAAAVMYWRWIPDVPWGGWVPNERFGTSPMHQVWRWSPDLLAVAAIALLLWAWRTQQAAQSAGREAAGGDGVGAVDPFDPVFLVGGLFTAFTFATAAATGATPASFVPLVPFVWMAAAALLLAGWKSNLPGTVVCFIAVGFNLYNSGGAALPPLADKGSRAWRTGALLERSREYLADYAATEEVLHLAAQAYDDSKAKAIAAPTPFVEHLAMPALGFATPSGLRGYSMSAFSTDRFRPIEAIQSEDPGDLAVVFAWNRYTTDNAWDNPPPQRGDVVLFDDPLGKTTAPLRLYVIRRIPSESSEFVRLKHSRRFWPEHRMVAAAREYLQNDDPLRAESILRLHLKTSPHSSAGHFMLGQILEQRGDVRAAVLEFRQVSPGSPDYWQALYRIAVSEVADGKLDDADAHFDECVRAYHKQSKSEPRVLARLYVSWAGVDVSRGAWGKAAEKLRQAIERDPTFADPYRELGFVLLAADKLTEALEPLGKALELNRQDAAAYRLLGTVHAGLDQWEAARDAFRQALALQPSDLEAQDSLATALERLGRYEDAIAEYEDALARLPDGPRKAPFLFGLAKAQKAAGHVEDAVDSLQSAIAAHADYKEALNELAWIFSTAPDDSIRDGTRAVELAERLTQGEEGQDPAYLDTLAAAYAEAGRFDSAVEAAQKALEGAKSSGKETLASEIESRLALFRLQQPYREPAQGAPDEPPGAAEPSAGAGP